MNKPISNWGTQPRRKRSPAMLSAKDELHLLRAWQQRGDKRARDKVITAFSPMAGAMAKRALAGSQTALILTEVTVFQPMPSGGSVLKFRTTSWQTDRLYGAQIQSTSENPSPTYRGLTRPF